MSIFTEELHEQYWQWVQYLNYTMAPWIFATAVGCYLGDSPKPITFLCAFFIILWGLTNPLFPRNLAKLENKKHVEHVGYYYKGFKSKNMGLVALVTRFHLFFISIISLSLVAVGYTKSAIGL
jgi:hypothetical protein